MHLIESIETKLGPIRDLSEQKEGRGCEREGRGPISGCELQALKS